MQHTFDMALAQIYGVKEAIFVHRLYRWVRDSAASGRNYRDGSDWTYDSLAALTQILPFWARRQLEGVIARCRDKGLIRTADYNAGRRDRTTWCTVTEAVQRAYAPIKADMPVPGNACPQTGKCMPPNCDTHSTERGNVYNEHLEDQLEDERARADGWTVEIDLGKARAYLKSIGVSVDGMLAVSRPIDPGHAGTRDDPIPCTWQPGTAGLWQWEEVK